MRDTVTYQGKEYPTRTFHVEVTGHDHEAYYTIVSDELIDTMRGNQEDEDADFEMGTEEYWIDGKIYHYVEPFVMDLNAKEICDKHLDIPLRLINEIL